MREVKNTFQKIWNFLKADSWPSLIVDLILAFLIIKFIFFPAMSFFTGAAMPLVIVESCSMYHSGDFPSIFNKTGVCSDGYSCKISDLYQEFNIFLKDTASWPFQNGINKGDIIFVVGPKNLKKGDVVIFYSNTQYPIIHRIVRINDTLTTKGDNNPGLLQAEKNISKESLMGKAIFRIPYLGWVKLIFYDFKNPQDQRGFCK